ncbi:hypothetical protein JKP88DRAFT_336560 [Tribonema minus]|uniref:TNFR-Cys domain-containing protein n=1 Tax=Tribonema minus TaxID=303371 RepID=A0A835YKB6_9STRA|nr:hypothetical protein JKP88DRAFT_336560 [Tribonema minus]
MAIANIQLGRLPNAYLAQPDLDNLKVAGVGHQLGDTWIFMPAGALGAATAARAPSAATTAGAPSAAVRGQEVYGQRGLVAQAVTPDTAPPLLLRHTLAFAHAALYLFFDEAVDIATLSTGAVSLGVSGGAAVPLACSAAAYGRWLAREVILDLRTPCLDARGNATGATDWSSLRTAGINGAAPTVLSAWGGYIADYGIPANEAAAVVAMAKTGPDCSPCVGSTFKFMSAPCNLQYLNPQPCASGTFMSAPCTAHGTFMSAPCAAQYDAACSRCSAACPGDTYRLAECTPETDLVCAACRDCPTSTYISGGCGGAQDRQCSPCTVCRAQPQGPIEPPLPPQYQLTDCFGTQDRTCASCYVCPPPRIPGAAAAIAAPSPLGPACDTAAVRTWRDEHCCKDSERRPVACSQAPLREDAIAARRAHRGF